MKILQGLWPALCLAVSSSWALAQPVWRCGPDGTQFQAVPCQDGQVLALRPAPDAAALREGRDVAQRERRALQTLASERLQRERDAVGRGLGPAGIQTLPRQAPAKSPNPKKQAPRKATPRVAPVSTPRPAVQGTSPSADRASPRRRD